MTKYIYSALLILLFATPVFAQKAIESEPGFVDVKQVESWFDQEPNLEVNIYGALLNLVAEASRFEDPELAELLHKLKGISVRGFQTDGIDMQSVRARTSTMSSRLKADGWETIVKVRDDDEFVDMYLKTIDSNIAGMIVMVINEDDEAVFVNIIGEIDPEQIGRIGQKFNVGGLGKF
ncbi:MAG: DUF4252 domain-containing protein [Rhodothermales bacterium]|nr:DUF4252 domain-containing protein [Rhodothermales bacterium]